MTHFPTQQRGATLIESLVSLIILAIAVIGMLGVQLRTLVETNVSANRSQAMLLAEDLSERIKANPRRFQALPQYAGLDVSSAPSISVDCHATPCSASQLLEYDRQEWSRSVINHLLGGRARTFISEGDARQLGVLIGWGSKEKSQQTAYTKSFQTPVNDVNDGISCWSGYICHLIYIQP